MKTISLTKGYKTVVDDEDFELLSRWKWLANVCTPNHVYARRKNWNKTTKRYESVLMHRLITRTTGKYQVDHINGDTLDNQKRNLRACTPRRNKQNRHQRKKRSARNPYIGVIAHHGKWKVQIAKKYVGFYNTPELAAEAYDKAALERYGAFANLNGLSKEEAGITKAH